MKYFLFSFLLFSTAFAQTPPRPTLTSNVLSFNIRYNNPKDGINAWPNRKALAAKVFTDYSVDFAGLQEALYGQITDLQDQLPAYAWIGVGRDDGKEKGEFSPIFYQKSRYEAVKSGTFWLSETPEVVGSKNWDAAITRVATWGIFRHKQSGKQLFVINTHFDHVGEQARQNSAKLLIRRIKDLSGGLPVILTGDFNTPENSPGIKTLTSDPDFWLRNTEHLSKEAHTGGYTTFNGFKYNATGPAIDFIFVGDKINVLRHDYLPIVEKDVFVSDHWPVLTRVEMVND